MRSALLEAWQHGGDGLPLVTRLVLTSETDSAGALIDSAADLRDVARAVAAAISPNLFTDKMITEEDTSELQALMSNSYAVFCLKIKTTNDMNLCENVNDDYQRN